MIAESRINSIRLVLPKGVWCNIVMRLEEMGAQQLYSDATEARFEAFRSKVADLAKLNTDGSLRVPDPYFRTAYEAISSHLGNPEFSVYNRLVRENLVRYAGRTLVNHANLLPRQYQDFILRVERRHRLDYPDTYESPDAWDSYPVVLQVSNYEQERFRYTSEINVRTNYPDRGMLIKLAGMLLDEDPLAGDTPPHNIIEVGCSHNHIGKKLAYPKRRHFPYPRPLLLDSPESDGTSVGEQQRSDQLHRLLNNDQTFPVEGVIGIDKQPIPKGGDDWAHNNYYPSEYRDNPEQIFDFSRFEDMDRDEVNVDFYLADSTEMDAEQFNSVFSDRPKADMVFMWSSAYQMLQQGVEATIKRLEPVMKPDAKVLLMDYVRIDTDGTMDFDFDWRPYNCGGYVLDMAARDEGWQQLFAIESPRVRSFALTPYAKQLAKDKRLPISE